jgi:7-cyano-7-deazaguanine reductase
LKTEVKLIYYRMPNPRKPKGLKLLGRSETRAPTAPSYDTLETFANPTRRPYWIRFHSADFTSLCPITGQADFAQITIDYMPGARCLETKSLKFYLASYRNMRAFNEHVTNQILEDLVKACGPLKMIVKAEFAARGGIALTVRAEFPDANPTTR